MGRIHGLWSGDLRPVAQLRAPGPTLDEVDGWGAAARGAGAGAA
ncbi:MAG: hypothetical protein U0790_19445 [Isosphaeraceae bacterium]